MEAVADRAGTSRAVLYRRWPKKAELVVAALRRHRPMLSGEVPDTGSLRGDVVALLTRMSDRLAQDRPRDRSMACSATTWPTPSCSTASRADVLQIGAEVMTTMLKRAAERGEARPRCQPEDRRPPHRPVPQRALPAPNPARQSRHRRDRRRRVPAVGAPLAANVGTAVDLSIGSSRQRDRHRACSPAPAFGSDPMRAVRAYRSPLVITALGSTAGSAVMLMDQPTAHRLLRDLVSCCRGAGRSRRASTPRADERPTYFDRRGRVALPRAAATNVLTAPGVGGCESWSTNSRWPPPTRDRARESMSASAEMRPSRCSSVR